MTLISRIAAPLLIAVFICQSSHAQSTAAQTQDSAPAPAPPTGCTSPESRQLDFWVGHWSVSPKGAPNRKIATSLIENLYSGCAIRENWMPIHGGGGGSLSSYLPDKKVWQQIWVDSSGSWVNFTGGWNGQAMVLEGVWPVPGHPQQRTRMSYRLLPDGTVEQSGVTSDNNGKSWQLGFDLIYIRIPESVPGTAGKSPSQETGAAPR